MLSLILQVVGEFLISVFMDKKNVSGVLSFSFS